jgi:hypothetical protein
MAGGNGLANDCNDLGWGGQSNNGKQWSGHPRVTTTQERKHTVNPKTLHDVKQLAETTRNGFAIRTLARAILEATGDPRQATKSERFERLAFDIAFFIEDPASLETCSLANALIALALRTPKMHRKTMADWLNARQIDWGIPAATGPGE